MADDDGEHLGYDGSVMPAQLAAALLAAILDTATPAARFLSKCLGIVEKTRLRWATLASGAPYYATNLFGPERDNGYAMAFLHTAFHRSYVFDDGDGSEYNLIAHAHFLVDTNHWIVHLVESIWNSEDVRYGEAAMDGFVLATLDNADEPAEHPQPEEPV